MKKNKKLFGTGLLVVCLTIAFLSFNKNKQDVNGNIAESDIEESVKAENQEIESQEIDKVDNTVIQEQNIYSNSETHPDFVKAYNDYETLLEDSTLVVYGQVKDTACFISDGNDTIYTSFDFNIEEVLKGEYDSNELSVITQGGAIPYSEYFSYNEELFRIKLSDKEFKNAQSDSVNRGNDLVVENFAGTDNINEGDKLLLFLRESEEGKYRIVGTSYYGKFVYDDSDETIYRINPEDNSQQLKIKLSDFRKNFKVVILDLVKNIYNLHLSIFL